MRTIDRNWKALDSSDWIQDIIACAKQPSCAAVIKVVAEETLFHGAKSSANSAVHAIGMVNVRCEQEDIDWWYKIMMLSNPIPSEEKTIGFVNDVFVCFSKTSEKYGVATVEQLIDGGQISERTRRLVMRLATRFFGPITDANEADAYGIAHNIEMADGSIMGELYETLEWKEISKIPDIHNEADHENFSWNVSITCPQPSDYEGNTSDTVGVLSTNKLHKALWPTSKTQTIGEEIEELKKFHETKGLAMDRVVPPIHNDKRLPIKLDLGGNYWVEQSRCKNCGQRVIVHLPERKCSADGPPHGSWKCPDCGLEEIEI